MRYYEFNRKGKLSDDRKELVDISLEMGVSEALGKLKRKNFISKHVPDEHKVGDNIEFDRSFITKIIRNISTPLVKLLLSEWSNREKTIYETQEIKTKKKLDSSYSLSEGRAESSKEVHKENVIDEDISGRITTLADLLRLGKVDEKTWRVDRYDLNKWDMGYKTQDGKAAIKELYQIKAYFKRNEKFEDYETLKNEILTLLENYTPPNLFKGISSFNPHPDDILLEMNLVDVHFGKLIWGAETAGPDYDLKIAEDKFLTAVSTLLERAKGFRPSKILWVYGNDGMNTDNMIMTTTAGTPQHDDTRWQKTITKTLELHCKAIEMCRQVAPVHALRVPGNHDYERSFHLGQALAAWFRNYDDVEVVNNPQSRVYFKHGKVLLGFTHGNNEKYEDLPLIMAQEAKEHWSDTLFREWHLGHYHKRAKRVTTTTDEFKGVVVRNLTTFMPTDQWHYVKGYVGNVGMSEAYLWSAIEGNIGYLTAYV